MAVTATPAMAAASPARRRLGASQEPLRADCEIQTKVHWSVCPHRALCTAHLLHQERLPIAILELRRGETRQEFAVSISHEARVRFSAFLRMADGRACAAIKELVGMPEATRLDQPADWSGHWWLPGALGNAVPGILRYNPQDGLRLSLIGGFDPFILHQVSEEQATAMANEYERWPVILGIADNIEITLLDCIPLTTTSYLPGLAAPSKQVLAATTALIGVHLPDEGEAVFTSSLVSVENLTQWSNSSILTSSSEGKGGRIDRVTLSMTPIAEPTVTVDDTAVTLVHAHTLPGIERSRGEIVRRMRDTAFVELRPQRRMTLTTAREFAETIQDLVSLATYQACALLELVLGVPPRPDDHLDDYPVRDREVKVYFRGTFTGDAEAKAINRSEALFTCRDIAFEEIVPRWWRLRKTCLPASNMVLGLSYAPAQYLEGNLLSAVGAAEVLHRCLGIGQRRIPAKAFNVMRETLLENTPEEHRQWIKSAIRNEPTLRDRLITLAGLPDSKAMQELVPDVDCWARITSRARNDLVHEGQTPRQSPDELVAATRVTTAVVMMNLLQALELPHERQQQAVFDNPRLHNAARLASKYLTED